MSDLLTPQAATTDGSVDAPSVATPMVGAPPRSPDEAGATTRAAANPLVVGAAALLSSAGAAWMAAGIFAGFLPRLVGLAGAVAGAGAMTAAYRSRQTRVLQYFGLAAPVLAGIVITMPATSQGPGQIPALVREAITLGGVGLAPVPFDPGWRFVLCLLSGLLAAGTVSTAIALGRPKLAALVPLPITAAAALLQPASATETSGLVALGCTMAAFALAFAAEQAREGATTASVEARRLGRSAGIMLLAVLVLFALNRSGLLVPEPNENQVVPPTRPEVPPSEPDRVLFTVTAPTPGPWRVGVLDVYADGAWLLPPYDNGRFRDLGSGGIVEGAVASEATYEARFEVRDVKGRTVPSMASAISVRDVPSGSQTDPRTDLLRLPMRAEPGTSYTVFANAAPSSAALTAAPSASALMAYFLEAPAAPPEVQSLLDAAPTTNAFDRLQSVRKDLYASVVASGSGKPVDLPPSRVVDMLSGGEATPYEITAAEALLARWAGVPARIGFGYYAGRATPGADGLTSWEVHPSDGRTYLEAYFEGFGFVPIVGVPLQAKASFGDEDKKQDPLIRPTDDILVQVFVPVRLDSLQLLFQRIRYLLSIFAPLVGLLVLLAAFLPVGVRAGRRLRRQVWATKAGPGQRIMVAYAEVRDVAIDLNIDGREDTPLEFLDRLEPDAEHRELAWLATRALWGDLRRGLTTEDAEAAESMATSLRRRLTKAQPRATRIAAAASRSSLRDPYLVEIPNLWGAHRADASPSERQGRSRTNRARVLLRRAKAMRATRALGTGVILLLVLSTSAAALASSSGPEARAAAARVGDGDLPASLDEGFAVGPVSFLRQSQYEDRFREPGDAALTSSGRLYTLMTSDGETKGYLEVGFLRPEYPTTRSAVRDGILNTIAAGAFVRQTIAGQEVYVQEERNQTYVLAFPDEADRFVLLVTKRGVEASASILAAVPSLLRGDDASFVVAKRFEPLRGGPL